MRYFVFLIAFIVLYGCKERPATTSDLLDYVPRKTVAIVKVSDYTTTVSDLRNNDFIQLMEGTPMYESLAKYSELSRHLDLEQGTLLCFTVVGKKEYEMTLITQSAPKLIRLDSTTVKTAALPDSIIKSWTTGEDMYYTLETEAVFLMSTSSLLLENVLRGGKPDVTTNQELKRAYAVAGKPFSLIMDGTQAGALWKTLLPNAASNPWNDTFSWAVTDVDLNQQDIKLDGIVRLKDSSTHQLSLFKNTTPVPNKVMNVTPTSAIVTTAITYDNWEVYRDNLEVLNSTTTTNFKLPNDSLFASFDEIGHIQLDTGAALVAHTVDATRTELHMPGVSATGDFRQVAIASIDDGDGLTNAFAKAYPILTKVEASYYCQLDDFYVFAASQELLELLIANYQNKTTLAHSSAFDATISQLSGASSLLVLDNLEKKRFTQWTGTGSKQVMDKMNLDYYPFGALQLIQERDFMHVHGLINKNEAVNDSEGIAQIASVRLDTDIIHGPQLVKNHRTKGMDIVVQDRNNRLYLINNAGKILWDKSLDSPILGDIQQVDLYRNGRLQLAFTTASGFYVLDRNGNHVAPFPITFNQAITQPLAVFDYENNRNYRFVITQNDRVSMYDKEAEKVSGFTFSKTESPIILSLIHI